MTPLNARKFKLNKKKQTNPWVEGWDIVGSTGNIYKLSVAADGETYGCSCPGWRFKKAPRPDCKHIINFKRERGILDQAQFKEQVAAVLAAAANRPMPVPESFVVDGERFTVTRKFKWV